MHPRCSTWGCTCQQRSANAVCAYRRATLAPTSTGRASRAHYSTCGRIHQRLFSLGVRRYKAPHTSACQVGLDDSPPHNVEVSYRLFVQQPPQIAQGPLLHREHPDRRALRDGAPYETTHLPQTRPCRAVISIRPGSDDADIPHLRIVLLFQAKSRRSAPPQISRTAPADLQREPVGSAIWAAKGNPNCRLPVTSRSYVGLPSRVLTSGRYFFWQDHYRSLRESAPPETKWFRTLLPAGHQCGEFRSVYLWTRDPYVRPNSPLISLGSQFNVNYTVVICARENYEFLTNYVVFQIPRAVCIVRTGRRPRRRRLCAPRMPDGAIGHQPVTHYPPLRRCKQEPPP